MRKGGEVYVCNRMLMNLQIQNASTVIGLFKPYPESGYFLVCIVTCQAVSVNLHTNVLRCER